MRGYGRLADRAGGVGLALTAAFLFGASAPVAKLLLAGGAPQLNLDGVFSALLAWFVFHENFDRRIALGMLAIVGGGAVLSWQGQRT